MTEVAASELEKSIGQIADEVIAEGKTGYNWTAVDALLESELGLVGQSRCKRAKKSGRAANVLTESNDKDIALYLVFVSPPYTIQQFQSVIKNRMGRFPNVRAVAVADRTSGEWRVRYYAEREGEGIADGLGDALTTEFPLLANPGAMETVPNELPADDVAGDGIPTVSIDEEVFDGLAAAFTAPEGAPNCALLHSFEEFISAHGLEIGRSVLADAVACCLSSQLIFFAGPSGTGKSRLARCLAEFFTSDDTVYVLEGRRQLLGPEDVAGYYSNIGQQFAVGTDTLGLIDLHEAAVSGDGAKYVPFMVLEEANLSAMEGYLAPVIHGLSATSSPTVKWPLHSRLTTIVDEELSVELPPRVFLGPYPRFLATINVDASAPAPARKVVSRGLVLLLEPETVDVQAMAARLSSTDPPAAAAAAGASWIADPGATMRSLDPTVLGQYIDVYLQLVATVSDPTSPAVPSYRDIARVAQYMANYVALVDGCEGAPAHEATIALAAENAFLHVTLPTLSPSGFASTIARLAGDSSLMQPPSAEGSNEIGGLLRSRVDRLALGLSASLFADAIDFWTALS